MEQAIAEWLSEIGLDQEPSRNISAKNLVSSYTIYGCMMLLPPGSFTTPEWHAVTHIDRAEDFERLYEIIAKHLKVTHIAINKPIPLQQEDDEKYNIIRAPLNFTPLYGDFGPTTCNSPPNQQDFDSAFWVTAKQNGIFQTWAPRWTMFSRGNITEKARLLSLPSVQQAIEEGKINGRGCAAIDLYAGIGYFAFSFAKAGFDSVLCWDLNPWSIEGLRRGARANKWSTATYSDQQGREDPAGMDANFLLFNESNEHAPSRMHRIQEHLPPVRHVNCGILPASQEGSQIALDVLDFNLGGWIHVHANFAVNEIEEKGRKIRDAFQIMVDRRDEETAVQLESIKRIKSYAPGVIHCVVDIYIPPSRRDYVSDATPCCRSITVG